MTFKEFIMIFVVGVLTLILQPAEAETVVQLHTFSYHKDLPDELKPNMLSLAKTRNQTT